jgi:hypothetical protein
VRPRFTTTLIALALAAPLAAGCGGDDEQNGEPIPAESAAALERQLDSIQNRLDAGGGACADITGNADPNTTAVESVINSLPKDVDPDVRDSLEQSFDHLFQLVEDQCDVEAGQDTAPETAAPPETDTQTTETLPPQEEEGDEGEGEEETPPPEEETQPEEVPTEEVPPGQGGDEPGQGEGGGFGQGGGGGAIVPGDGG